MISVIYLKEYDNGCLYVGRYRGTDWINYSKASGGGVARQYRWKPVSTTILEDTSMLTYKEHCAREVDFIDKYAILHGVHPLAVKLAHNKDFVLAYKVGLLLNTHDLDGSHCSDPEIRQKALKTILNKNTLHFKEMHENMSKGLLSDRAKKSNATRKSRGDKFFSKDTVTKSHSVEANIKRKESYRNTAGKYQLSDGFIGTSGQIAEHLNCSNTYASVYCRSSLINDVTITRGRFKGLTFKKFKE